MTLIPNEHQMGTVAAEGRPLLGAMRRLALGARDECQDWPLRSGQGSLTYCLNSRLVRVATLASHQFSSRGASKARDRRQAFGFPSLAREPVATQFKFMHGVMAPCSQFRVPHNTLRQDRYVGERHNLERLSSVVGSMPNHDRSALADVQIQLPRGKYV